MKQQFFVGDVVKLNQLGVEVGNRAIQDANHDLWNSKYLLMLKQQGTAVVSKPATILDNKVWLEDNAFFVTPEHLEVVERAWQKNTGKQPVDGKIEVEIKLPSCATDKAPAYQYRWDFEDSSGDIVEWRIADSVSFSKEQPEGIPPSHVALGEEIAAVDAIPIEQEWTDKHYDNNYTLTQKDIERGFVKIDPYRVSKQWRLGSKDESGVLWHCKNKYSREVKPNVFVDVYDVLRAFEVTDPCLSHLAKKALCAGLRGHKDRLEDLNDIKASIERAIEMHLEWSENG